MDQNNFTNIEINRPICVAIEGLDGIGKSTTINALKDKLNGIIIQTPPQVLKPFRHIFANGTKDFRLAYYMVGNYMAAEDIKSKLLEGSSVVLDRFYASTIAYIVGKSEDDLPEQSNNVYNWPSELYKPDFMFVLTMNETDRIERLVKRSSICGETLTQEDILIRSNPAISERINIAYKHLGCVEIIVEKTDSTSDIVNKITNYIYNNM